MRVLAMLRAKLTGYFWLPCPRCGRRFGGHEKGSGRLTVSAGRGTLTCPHCPGEWVLHDGRVWRVAAGLDAHGTPYLALRLPS